MVRRVVRIRGPCMGVGGAGGELLPDPLGDNPLGCVFVWSERLAKKLPLERRIIICTHEEATENH